MKNLLITSFERGLQNSDKMFEIDASLLDSISGGADGCHLTSVWKDGKLSEPKLDEDKTA